MADKISECKYGLSGSNRIRTHNHLVRKRILNQLAKLECWWVFFNWGEEPLRDMELQEKEAQKHYSIPEICLKEPTVKKCILILDLNSLRL